MPKRRIGRYVFVKGKKSFKNEYHRFLRKSKKLGLAKIKNSDSPENDVFINKFRFPDKWDYY